MSEREEVLLQQGFVLHHRPFRNSSLLIDCLTPEYGRVGLVAQGSRRARTGNRALLQPFSLLRLSWVRRSDLGRLTHVEADQRVRGLRGDALLAGFYINELLLRLMARGDRNDEIFSCYSACLAELAGEANVARSLRFFELSLLDALGYRVELDQDMKTGEPLRPDCDYLFEPEGGPSLYRAKSAEEPFSGEHLISLRERSLEDQASLRTAKRLLERILTAYLGERPLKSRLVLKEIVDGGFER